MASRATTENSNSSQSAARGKWLKVRFGDVVRDVKATVDRETTNLTRFVAGEHMGSEDIHLRTWGDINGDYLGPAFHRSFQQGQVLYGSRRTYLKKIAVAPFDGICANTTFVLESRDPEVLLPELLPFIMLTDAFTEHSIRESKGSVNPYVNWKDIAKYEFQLPPKDEQHRIAEILSAAAETVSAGEQVQHSLRLLKSSLQLQLLQNGIRQGPVKTSSLGDIPSHWTERRLIDVTDRICVGLAMSVTEYYRETGVPILRNQNIRPLKLDDAELIYLDPSFADSLHSKKVKTGDVLTARTGANMGQTCLVPPKYNGAHTFTTLITTCNKNLLLPEFFVQHMNSTYGLREMERLSTTGGKNNLNVTDFAEYRLAVPPINEQRQIAKMFEDADRTIAIAEGNVGDAKVLAKTLLASVFGDVLDSPGGG